MEDNCKVITVYSPKGGCGVTAIACNLAASMSQQSEKKILLFSVHTKFSKSFTSFFDMDFKVYLSNLDMDKIGESVLPSYLNSYLIKKSRFYVLSLLENTDSLAQTPVNKIEDFLIKAKKFFDFIIIDTPHDFDEYNMTAFDHSHLILIATEPTIPSVIKIKECLNVFRTNLYPLELIKLLVNSFNISYALKAAEIQDALKIEVFDNLPYDKEELTNSFQVGKPLVELNPKAKFSSAIFKLAQYIDKGYKEEKKSLFSSIVSEVIRKKHQTEEIKKTDTVVPVTQTESSQDYSQVKENIHKKLVTEINIEATAMDKTKLREETRKVIEKLISEEKNAPYNRDQRELLVNEILDEALGLGPLEPLLKDPQVTEIMVISKDETYIEKKGKLQLANIQFLSDQQLLKFCERIVTPLGRRIDESSPYVDARLPDGSRVHIIIPPLALDGPTITIRKFSQKKLGPADLLRFDSVDEQMIQFIEWCVLIRKNIVISGGTGSGKTTLLNISSGFIPSDERIITIEDSAELQLQQPHIVRLESRPPSIEGTGEVKIRDLVKCSLRMRPDRIVVGECRGGEALDMLQAMNTGHDGSLTTVHSNSPRDCISRLQTLCLMAGMELPAKAILEQIAGAIDIIIQQSRLSDGSRKIINITEVTGMEGEVITLQDLFIYKQIGIKEDGKVDGYFTPTGIMPTFYEELKAKGIKADPKIFQPTE